MITTDRDALLRAVLDHPDDDLPRLAFADWCEENGDDARAEFVRVQVALWDAQRDCLCGSRTGGHRFTGGQHHNGPCAASQLRVESGGRSVRARVREVELFDALFAAPHHPWGRVECSRGFIHRVTIAHDAWLEHGPALVRAHPIGRVELTDRSPWTGRGDAEWRSPGGDGAANEAFAKNTLSPAVWELLGGIRHDDLSNWKRCLSEAAARDALSAALLAFARNADVKETE